MGLWDQDMNPHAKETGILELETLSNTFLIYAPMQLIAGRQRPGEGNGNGDFFLRHAMNTSFPGGHAMFTWGMATVLAREYPKTWVRVLAYGAAGTVTVSRFMAHDHWSSDMLVGLVLGFAIGTHILPLPLQSRIKPVVPSPRQRLDRVHGAKLGRKLIGNPLATCRRNQCCSGSAKIGA